MSELTPFQQKIMRAWKCSGWANNLILDRIARWQRTNDSVPLEEVADWCARERKSVVRNEEQRASAYADLAQAIAKGEFNYRGRICIAYLLAAIKERGGRRVRLRIEDALYPHVLEQCWAPRLPAPAGVANPFGFCACIHAQEKPQARNPRCAAAAKRPATSSRPSPSPVSLL